MKSYYIRLKPFGIGSKVVVSSKMNLTKKGAVKKFAELGYKVTEDDIKDEPFIRPCIGFDFHIPTYSQEDIERCKHNGQLFPMPHQAKKWNTDRNTAINDCKIAETILKAADIDVKCYSAYMEIYKDTNSEEGIEFAKIVCNTICKPKKEL